MDRVWCLNLWLSNFWRLCTLIFMVFKTAISDRDKSFHANQPLLGRPTSILRQSCIRVSKAVLGCGICKHTKQPSHLFSCLHFSESLPRYPQRRLHPLQYCHAVFILTRKSTCLDCRIGHAWLRGKNGVASLRGSFIEANA